SNNCRCSGSLKKRGRCSRLASTSFRQGDSRTQRNRSWPHITFPRLPALIREQLAERLPREEGRRFVLERNGQPVAVRFPRERAVPDPGGHDGEFERHHTLLSQKPRTRPLRTR